MSCKKKINTFQKKGNRVPFFFPRQLFTDSYLGPEGQSKDCFLLMYYCFLSSLSDSLIHVSHPKEIRHIDWEADSVWYAPWGPHHLQLRLWKISVSWKLPLKLAKSKVLRGKDLQCHRFTTVCIAFPGHDYR